MRSLSPTIQSYLSAREGVVARTLVWIEAKNRDTGLPETVGLWNGDDHETLTVEGEARMYYGAGGLIQIEPLRFQVGLVVRQQKMVVSPLAPELEQALRGYDPRFAPVEIHQALYHTESRALVDTPARKFKGWIDKLQFKTPAKGGEAICDVTLVSSSRAVTRPLPLKKSDEAQKLRGGDRLRRYVDVSGKVPVYWGENRLNG